MFDEFLKALEKDQPRSGEEKEGEEAKQQTQQDQTAEVQTQNVQQAQADVQTQNPIEQIRNELLALTTTMTVDILRLIYETSHKPMVGAEFEDVMKEMQELTKDKTVQLLLASGEATIADLYKGAINEIISRKAESGEGTVEDAGVQPAPDANRKMEDVSKEEKPKEPDELLLESIKKHIAEV